MKMLFFEVDDAQALYFKKAFLHDELYFYKYALTSQTIPTEHHDAQLISVFVHSRINKEVFDQFPYLAFVITRSTGLDHIDCEVAQEKTIKVCSLPHYATQAVAEYTFALLLSLVRKIRMVEQHESNDGQESLCGIELAHKTLGIVGLGSIGTAVACIALGFSMKVIVYDPWCKGSSLGVSFVSLKELLQQADVISMHVPLTSTTHHMIDRDTFKQCKKGLFLINTSRGAVIETTALIDALEKSIVAGVALDVLEEENFTRDLASLIASDQVTRNEYKKVIENMYLDHHPRVIISPHNAFNTHEALCRSLQATIECIEAWKKTI